MHFKEKCMWIYFWMCLFFNWLSNILGKQYGLTNSWWYVAFAAVSTLLASLCWSFSIKHGMNISTGTPMMGIFLITTTILAGLFFYGEPITLRQWAGFILGGVAVFLITK